MSKLTLQKITPLTPRLRHNMRSSFTVELHSAAVITGVEFKVRYMVPLDTDLHDQDLADYAIESIPAGNVTFVLECDPIRHEAPFSFGVSSILFVGYYKGAEFLRVGFYVQVGYEGIPFDLLCAMADNEEELERENFLEQDGDESASQDTAGEDEGYSIEDTADSDGAGSARDVSTPEEEGPEADEECPQEGGSEEGSQEAGGSENSQKGEEDSGIESDLEENSSQASSERSESPVEKEQIEEKHIADENASVKSETKGEMCVEGEEVKDVKETVGTQEPDVHDSAVRSEMIKNTVWPDASTIPEKDQVISLGYVFDRKDVVVSICDDPLVTVFSIDWSNKPKREDDAPSGSTDDEEEEEGATKKKWKRH